MPLLVVLLASLAACLPGDPPPQWVTDTPAPTATEGAPRPTPTFASTITATPPPEPPSPTPPAPTLPVADYTARVTAERVDVRDASEGGRVIGQLGADAIVPVYLPVLAEDVRGLPIEGGWCVMHPEGWLYLACRDLDPLGEDLLPAQEAAVIGANPYDCGVVTYYDPALRLPRANVCADQPVWVYAERLNADGERACAILPATRHPTEGEWVACDALTLPDLFLPGDQTTGG